MFLIFTTQLYQYYSLFFLFAIFNDEPEVFLPKYSQTAILHAAHFRRVVKSGYLDSQVSQLCIVQCGWPHLPVSKIEEGRSATFTCVQWDSTHLLVSKARPLRGDTKIHH